MVRKKTKRRSALAERIALGKADPISTEEREIVAALRADFDRKFGDKPIRVWSSDRGRLKKTLPKKS